MIATIVIVLAIGIVVGILMDALLRGRDPRSWAVTLWAVGGAVGAVTARFGIDSPGLLVVYLSAVAGAMLLAFAARARVSSLIERAATLAARRAAA
jgi:hypothetical protein